MNLQSVQHLSGYYLTTMVGPKTEFAKILQDDKELDDLDMLELNFPFEQTLSEVFTTGKVTVAGKKFNALTMKMLNKLWTMQNDIVMRQRKTRHDEAFQ